MPQNATPASYMQNHPFKISLQLVNGKLWLYILLLASLRKRRKQVSVLFNGGRYLLSEDRPNHSKKKNELKADLKCQS